MSKGAAKCQADVIIDRLHCGEIFKIDFTEDYFDFIISQNGWNGKQISF